MLCGLQKLQKKEELPQKRERQEAEIDMLQPVRDIDRKKSKADYKRARR